MNGLEPDVVVYPPRPSRALQRIAERFEQYVRLAKPGEVWRRSKTQAKKELLYVAGVFSQLFSNFSNDKQKEMVNELAEKDVYKEPTDLFGKVHSPFYSIPGPPDPVKLANWQYGNELSERPLYKRESLSDDNLRNQTTPTIYAS